MIDVYVASLPKREPSTQLFCKERQRDIDSISNVKVRREKYYAWRLLEYAIKNSLGADASRLCFTKGENRKWFCEGFEFSLSHSGDALAVAISDKPVGVDVERIRVKSADRLADFVLTESERAEYEKIADCERDEWLIRKWCAKEAIFKSQNRDAFTPSKIAIADFFTRVENISIENEKYILAVAAVGADTVRIFDRVEFKID